MPNQLGQAYGLTVLSPLKPDEADAAIAVVRSLDDRTHDPFEKVGSRGRSVHTARWVLVDGVPAESNGSKDALKSKYLLFDANIDTDERGLDGFLADIVSAMGADIDAIYGHCVGYTGTATFAAYIKKCQIETTFFFVDYATEERGKVENVLAALAHQKGFVDCAQAVQGLSAAQARPIIERYMRAFTWSAPLPAKKAKPVATSSPRKLPEQVVEVHDVQGNVLRGYKHNFARHLYFHVTDAVAARRGLAELTPSIAHSGDWGKHKPHTTMNVAFSFAGLRALGVPEATLSGFPIAFQMGMRKRALVLGDTSASAPENWEKAANGAELWTDDGVHVLVSVYANSDAARDRQAESVLQAMQSGCDHVGSQDATATPERREHFGFTDGFGTVDIGGTRFPTTPGSGKRDTNGGWTPIAPGEFLFGYRDEANELPDAPEPASLVKNGTFLVFRKLYENVALYRKYLHAHADYPGGEELLAAKIVGRFPDGTPLALSSVPDPALVKDAGRVNDFGYADDPEGAKCPLGAHVRRSRPRDAGGFDGRLADRRRIQRRGMPYGPELEGDEDDGVDRGIVFMAFNIDIERQFEFIQQQWLNYGNAFGQANDKDILSGDHDGHGKAVIQATGPGTGPYFCAALPRFVEMRGGAYFFMPGLAGLSLLTHLTR